MSKEKEKKLKKEDTDNELEVEEMAVPVAPAAVGAAKASDNDNDLKELIEKNIKWSQVIYNQNKKIKHRLTMMVVGSYLRLALIIVPIVLGIIYLPPLMEKFFEQYQDVMGGVVFPVNITDLFQQLKNNGTSINLNDPQLQESLRAMQR